MTSNNRIPSLAVATVLLAAAPGAYATLATAAPFEQKVDNAASIFLGKCVKTESRVDPSQRWILTYSTFEVEKSIKGSAGSQITIVTPGGQVGSTRQDTIGIPSFREGDENVLFVKNSEAGPTVLFFDQGAYDVTTDSHGEKVVSPVQSTLVKIDTQRGIAVPSEMPRTLRAFQSDVDETLASARQRHMQYEMVQAKGRKEASLGSILMKYKFIIAVAAIGAALATWQLRRG